MTPFSAGAEPASVVVVLHLFPLSRVLNQPEGLTLVHYSARLEPYLSQENPLHTLNTPLTRATQSLRAPPIPYKALKLS